ncbi:MAG: hypothetical protein ABIR67_12960, partial [Gaiellaceae bacterium]
MESADTREELLQEEAGDGLTRRAVLARAGVVGGAALALPALGALARPGVALADEVAPAPPSIGADIPLTYFGPSPSQVQKELVGP